MPTMDVRLTDDFERLDLEEAFGLTNADYQCCPKCGAMIDDIDWDGESGMCRGCAGVHTGERSMTAIFRKDGSPVTIVLTGGAMTDLAREIRKSRMPLPYHDSRTGVTVLEIEGL
jgi:hypothetical protein